MAVQFDYRRFTAFPGNITGLPQWAQIVVVTSAIPGVLILAAAALLATAGIIVIGLLALPVYRVLKTLVGRPLSVSSMVPPDIEIVPSQADQPPGERRQIESRIVK